MNCLVCGKPIPKRAKKYCSLECYHKSGMKSRPPMKARAACLVCGKPIATVNKRFCSHACYSQYWTGREKPAARRRFTRVCRQCGKEFKVGGKGGKHKEAIYCSRECLSASQIKETGGRAWRRLSQSVIDRDKRCVLCGKDDRRLQAHHIVPKDYSHWRYFNGDETMSDLIAVCVHCHWSLDTITQAGYRNNPNFDPHKLIEMIREVL